MSDVTQLLHSLSSGKPEAAEELLPLVYDELRRMAAARLGREKSDISIETTALVHEAYLRMVAGDAQMSWANRRHFFSIAAEAMRRILVDHARAKKAIKRGAGMVKEQFQDEVSAAMQLPVEDVLAVNDALNQLAAIDPEAAEVVKLRCFAGLEMTEIAELLEVSRQTVHDNWDYAKSWLYKKLSP